MQIKKKKKTLWTREEFNKWQHLIVLFETWMILQVLSQWAPLKDTSPPWPSGIDVPLILLPHPPRLTDTCLVDGHRAFWNWFYLPLCISYLTAWRLTWALSTASTYIGYHNKKFIIISPLFLIHFLFNYILTVCIICCFASIQRLHFLNMSWVSLWEGQGEEELWRGI